MAFFNAARRYLISNECWRICYMIRMLLSVNGSAVQDVGAHLTGQYPEYRDVNRIFVTQFQYALVNLLVAVPGGKMTQNELLYV